MRPPSLSWMIVRLFPSRSVPRKCFYLRATRIASDDTFARQSQGNFLAPSASHHDRLSSSNASGIPSAIIGNALWCCCTSVRKWWNWQTHHLEGVAPKGVGVQIPPSAPILLFSIRTEVNLTQRTKPTGAIVIARSFFSADSRVKPRVRFADGEGRRPGAVRSLAEWPMAKFSWLSDHGPVTICAGDSVTPQLAR